MVAVNGNGQLKDSQRTQSDCRSPRRGRPAAVARTVVSSTSLASTSASFTPVRRVWRRPRPASPGRGPADPSSAGGHAAAKVADLQQVGHLVEGETQALRRLDHPQHRDGFGRIEPVTTQGAVRFMQEAAALVIAQGRAIPPRGVSTCRCVFSRFSNSVSCCSAEAALVHVVSKTMSFAICLIFFPFLGGVERR